MRIILIPVTTALIVVFSLFVSVTTAVAVSSPACPLAGTTLKKGSSGDAVKRWQVKFNIVTSGNPDTTGYGAVGPRTIAAMVTQCPGSTQRPIAAAPALGGDIWASPIVRYAPLDRKST